MTSSPPLAFNPGPRLELLRWSNGQICIVVDDALVDPDALVAHAAAHRQAFRTVDFNAYPGVLLPSPTEHKRVLHDFFLQHIRRHFDARRAIRMHSRLALVTLPPTQLQPCQSLCHRDSQSAEPGESIQACVLYLFRDPALGGTSFYEPNLSERETDLLFHHASTMPPAEFTRRFGIAPGYMCGSNRYFTRVGGVAAKWNRLVFYDGAALHSGDIAAPERLSADPRAGRLTLNGFFTCRRRAA